MACRTVGTGEGGRGWRVASQRVLSLGCGATVAGVAASAGAVVAHEMVEFQPFGDRADFSLVAVSVSEPEAPFTERFTVPANRARPLPDVAPVLVGDPAYAAPHSTAPLATAEGNKHAGFHSSNLHSFGHSAERIS